MKTAPVKWAQRKDSLYITIGLPDVKDHKIGVTEKSVSFSGTSNGVPYSANLEFLEDVDPQSEGSVWNVLPSSVQMKLMKKDRDKEEFWPRLLKDKVLEKNTVTVDWDRYVDDDEGGDEDFDMNSMGTGQGFGGGGMPGMGGAGSPEGMDIQKMLAQMQAGGGMPDGMPDMGTEDDADSDDDEDLPDLEETA